MATCGACKTPNVPVAHVKECYGQKYSDKGTIPVAPSLAHDAPKVVVLPKVARYALQDGDGSIVHYLITAAKNGQGFNVKTWHGSFNCYVGFLKNDHTFYPSHDSRVHHGKAVAAIVASPIKAALLFSETTGRCSMCGRELKDPKSVGASMGPVCCKKLGLKHGQVAA